MTDLSILFITASNLPKSWTKYQQERLLEAAGEYPIISVSREPLDLGTNLLDTEPKSMSNIYFQMLRAAKVAETPYVAVAEADCLYPKEHFISRPAMDEFLYNQNRWAVFLWGIPMYSWRNRKSNATLIAPRELLIEALEERFAKWPQGTPENLTGELGRRMVEKNLGVTHRKSKEVYSEVSVIQINHDNASEDRQRRHRKSLGPMKCFDMYFWRHAKDIVRRYNK